MKPIGLTWIRKILGARRVGMSSLAVLSTGGGIPVRQTQLAPDGLEFSGDVSQARWIEESLSEWKLGMLAAIMPASFLVYARIFHPAYLGEREEKPVRWSTVASWTGRTVHPQMQFERIAALSEELRDLYKDPPWGHLPQYGSIPEDECRTLQNVLKAFTSTPDQCYFCLWEGYGNIDTRLYKRGARVRTPGRDYLLFRGPLDAVMSFLGDRTDPFWGYSPNIWWPEDRAWCVSTEIDLFDTYLGGSRECIDAVLSTPELEVLPTIFETRVDVGGDVVNAPDTVGKSG